MWYFTWVLGVGFAVLLAILNAMWGENEDARQVLVADGRSPEKASGKRNGRRGKQ